MEKILKEIEKHADLIFKAERQIWSTPETGFKEYKTSEYLSRQFEALGYTLNYAEGITGFYTDIDTGKDGPTLMMLAELDSVICHSHKEADQKTGAVHSCGHNAQCAALLGIAAALKTGDLLEGLSGKIRLCAVPAEECLEMEYRASLRERGVIKYLGGKSEFLRRGYFDGVDIAFMVHQTSGSGCSVNVGGDSGFIAKTVVYKGVTAHAACAAYLAKNALYAATAGLSAVNALRETFREDTDRVRFHPIITHGGDIVNNIPERVVIESMLRAANYEALIKENRRIDRALIGAALSFGVDIEINDEPGYAPLINDESLALLAKEAYEGLYPDRECKVYGGLGSGVTDMGDLSMLMPVIHPYIGGAVGKGHGEDYYITAPSLACLSSAAWQIATARLLLSDGAKRARKIIDNYRPTFKSREEFLKKQDTLRRSGDRIEYKDDGTAVIIN